MKCFFFLLFLSTYSFFVFFRWFLQNRCPWISTQIQMIIMIIITVFFSFWFAQTNTRPGISLEFYAREGREIAVCQINFFPSISSDRTLNQSNQLIRIYRRKSSVSLSRRARPHSVYMKHTIERLGSLSLEECPTS